MDDQERDARARLGELWSAHADAVLGYAVLRTDARHRAEEVVSEVFVVAWRRLDDVPDDARPWLLGVARKVLGNSRRGDGRHDALVRRLGERAAHVHQGVPDHADEVAGRLRVVEALRRVPDADREVLVLVGVHGLTGPQAARVLGCSAPTAAVRLHRARRRLRRVLEHLDGEPPPPDPVVVGSADDAPADGERGREDAAAGTRSTTTTTTSPADEEAGR